MTVTSSCLEDRSHLDPLDVVDIRWDECAAEEVGTMDGYMRTTKLFQPEPEAAAGAQFRLKIARSLFGELLKWDQPRASGWRLW